ncbi:alpha/beta-hydrolase [Daedalea quercina L-15889]|uniref:Alpha/beta-hydrolase n=1 Tax=Daedalea quercina L-15889 TaxID=1314783 RepID=A0A165UAX2_9APHY|nr:alpha/beta-hydrolase [Daedalea quercina L-15889]
MGQLSLFQWLSATAKDELTPAQKHMYTSEKLDNFRAISKLCATRSSYTLTSKDVAPADLYFDLTDLGEFAQIAFNLPDPRFLFDNLEMFMQPGYPFEGFKALRNARLVSCFQGTVADVPGVVVYRPGIKQLVVGFAGTANMKQALYDLNFMKRRHPFGDGYVHSGFYAMYEGCKGQVIDCLKKGFAEHDVQQVAIVGHSMGGALSYLLAIDVLAGEYPMPPGVTVTVATFGCPRVGDAALSEFWQQLVAKYHAANGEASVKDYSMKGLNDGVPCLPPVSWGYRHIARTPLYLYHGRLFHVPRAEVEHGIFTVDKEALDHTRVPDYPRGGHNYYGRDAEKIMRRVYWLDRMMSRKTEGWQEEYLAKMAELERVK